MSRAPKASAAQDTESLYQKLIAATREMRRRDLRFPEQPHRDRASYPFTLHLEGSRCGQSKGEHPDCMAPHDHPAWCSECLTDIRAGKRGQPFMVPTAKPGTRVPR